MKKAIFILAAMMFLWVSQAWAYEITISNFSFETPILQPDVSVEDGINYWSHYNAGIWYPPQDEDVLIKPEHGNQVGYAYYQCTGGTCSNGSLYQWLPSADENNLFKVNYKYALSVYVGTWFSDVDYKIYLLGNRQLEPGDKTVNVLEGTISKKDDLKMTEMRLEYTVRPGDWFIGRNIGIALDSSIGSGTDYRDLYFDKVTLTATPVPIPPSVWLLGAGLLGLAGLRRRFKN